MPTNAPTLVPRLPGVVAAWRGPLCVMQIARRAGCSEAAVRRYLRLLGKLGPPRIVSQPKRGRKRDEDDEHCVRPPTPEEIAIRAAEIRREGLDATRDRVRRNAGPHGGWGYGARIYKDPTRLY